MIMHLNNMQIYYLYLGTINNSSINVLNPDLWNMMKYTCVYRCQVVETCNKFQCNVVSLLCSCLLLSSDNSLEHLLYQQPKLWLGFTYGCLIINHYRGTHFSLILNLISVFVSQTVSSSDLLALHIRTCRTTVQSIQPSKQPQVEQHCKG